MAQDDTNARVISRVDVNPDLMILRVEPDGWALPPFIPGQYAVLGLPGASPRVAGSDPEDPPAPPETLIRRAYSLASASDATHAEFYVTLVRSGLLTPRLFALAEGDRVFLGRRITGMFNIDRVPEDRHVVMVATGTGLAPYISMLRSRLVCDAARRFAVLLGARHSWDLGYHAELLDIARYCANFSYVATISRPDAEPVPWTGRTGYVQDLWAERVLEGLWGRPVTPADTHVFLCGNPKMVEAMLPRLASEGFTEHHARRNPDGQVHTEKYW